MVRYYLRLWVFKRPRKGMCGTDAPCSPKTYSYYQPPQGWMSSQVERLHQIFITAKEKLISTYNRNHPAQDLSIQPITIPNPLNRTAIQNGSLILPQENN